MKDYTSYEASRKNVFVWIVALLCAVSAVARIIFVASGVVMIRWTIVSVFFRIILPIAANFLMGLRLPLRGQKMFYVTVNPVIAYAIYFVYIGFTFGFSFRISALIILLAFVVAMVYTMTYTGKLGNQFLALIVSLVPLVIYLADPTAKFTMAAMFPLYKWGIISAAAMYFSVICCILSARRLPAWKEGELYRLHYGDRPDGRLIKNIPPMTKIIPYMMPTRNQSTNIIFDAVEISEMQKYIREKRKEGLKHFGITHVFIASYVRCCNDCPGVNRFLSGQRIYHRFGIDVNMTIKKDMNTLAPDTAIKVSFEPNDTATEIYEKFDAAVQNVKNTPLDSGTDKLTDVINYIPGLIKKFVIWSLKTLDYFSILPPELMRLSPFHGSMFITSMGSLGIPPIVHHLYDFGNVPVFIAFGRKRTEYEAQRDGTIAQKKYVDFSVATDERICDGFYYATVLKKLQSYLSHPYKLDEKPELQDDVY